jgi:tRNA G46 methylase TrmB
MSEATDWEEYLRLLDEYRDLDNQPRGKNQEQNEKLNRKQERLRTRLESMAKRMGRNLDDDLNNPEMGR